MNVSIIENWTEIGGVVSTTAPSAERPSFISLLVDVEWTKPVEGFANLLGDSAGKRLTILAPADLVMKLNVRPGDRLTGRVRQGGPRKIFVHQQHITIGSNAAQGEA